ncbi:hypothetical protein IQ07DRAFT_663555 [Pyrenochaeta sp. DS3sAY3a]|nr:hypothetical protein IQ07DRAFT_663555 [Pyrenochaeta sp. DS3sAY3a]
MNFDAREVAKHNSRRSCWIVISGQVYDVTAFLDDHPGGPNVILRYGGKDATEEYALIHPPGTIEKELPSDKHLGAIDPNTIEQDAGHIQASEAMFGKSSSSIDLMPLPVCQNLDDIEYVAQQKLPKKTWVYYDSAADSLASQTNNRADWMCVTFRPRIMRDVARVVMKRRYLGHENDLPFFIAPAAMAKLGHPDGELCLARGAARSNITYCTSTYSSVSHDSIAECLRQERKRGALAFQLYIPKAKRNGEKLIAMARKLGFKALVITVDTAVVGKREADERAKAEVEWQENGGIEVPRVPDPDPNAEAPILRGAHSSSLVWEDLTWIREKWGPNSGPVYLKGIQSAEDAKLALDMGLDGIYLSNHGGRQLDFAPSSIRTLLEIKKFHPEILTRMEVLVDGGVRRGTDVIKALCLGATAVGLGRPFMYALSAYGTEGVMRAIQLLSEEIETTMRLLGITHLDQLNDKQVNAVALERELMRDISNDALYSQPSKL